jgi:hypothetical protein
LAILHQKKTKKNNYDNARFLEQFEKENERFERRVAKKKKLTKKVEGFGEVTGTWRNQEGQEMARILFLFRQRQNSRV